MKGWPICLFSVAVHFEVAVDEGDVCKAKTLVEGIQEKESCTWQFATLILHELGEGYKPQILSFYLGISLDEVNAMFDF